MENPMEKCARCQFKTKNGDKYYCGLTFQDINDEIQCIIEIIEKPLKLKVMENPMEKCARCQFKTKNGDKYYCGLTLRDITDEMECTVEIDELDNEAVAEVLRCHNIWRRGADIDPVPPRLLGLALDKACEIIKEGH